MALETVRQNVAAANVTSPVGVEIVAEKRGAYRGEGVRTVGDNARASLVNASRQGPQARQMDSASLQRRVILQGQGTSFKATPRLTSYYDKLPQMPQMAALQTLVAILEKFQAQQGVERGERDPGEAGAPVADGDAQMQGTTPASAQAPITGHLGRSSGQGSGDSGGEGQHQDQQGHRGAQQLTKEKVFELLQATDPDVTHQAAALDVLREHFESAGADAAFLATLGEAAAAFESGDLGRDVRAGLASAQIASQQAQTLETNPAAVRDTYRLFLREQQNIGQIFDRLATFDRARDIQSVIEVFRQIASQDFASTGPSTDPLFLHHLLTELGKLKKMQTTFEGGSALLALVKRCLGSMDALPATPTDVASRLLNYAAKATVGLSDARLLLSGMEHICLECQLVFANGLRGLHVALPDEIMPSVAARMQQITAMMTVIDALVQEEEAAHAEAASSPAMAQT